MIITTGKSKKWSLNSRKLLKTEKLRVSWKIQNAIKSEWKEELGWNCQDLLLSKIPTNGQNLKQIEGYQFQTLGEVDWTDPYIYLCLLNILLCYIDYQVHNSNSISVFWFYILIKDGSLTRLIVPKSGSPRLSCQFILLKIVSNSNFIDIRLIIYQ